MNTEIIPIFNMKRIPTTFCWFTASLMALISFTAQGGVILGSKHDLSSQTTNTTEVCVFCHTPHGADTGASVPLWNKKLPAAGGYSRYSSLNTSSLDGEEAPVGSVSLACLSCHDGVQAMDVLINAPGSGGYDGAGAEFDLGAIGTMPGDGVALSAPIPNLGTDLQDDHPISIQYAGGGCSDADGTGAGCGSLGDTDFKPPYSADINNVRIWWVDVAGVGVREKGDMQLYTRTDVDGTTVEPTVECGSCHDPHNQGSTPVDFLRVNNTNSDVCLACHIK